MVVLVSACLCESQIEMEDSYTHPRLSHREHKVLFAHNQVFLPWSLRIHTFVLRPCDLWKVLYSDSILGIPSEYSDKPINVKQHNPNKTEKSYQHFEKRNSYECFITNLLAFLESPVNVSWYCNNFQKVPKNNKRKGKMTEASFCHYVMTLGAIILMCGEQSCKTRGSKCTDVWTMQRVALHECDANDSEKLFPERK